MDSKNKQEDLIFSSDLEYNSTNFESSTITESQSFTTRSTLNTSSEVGESKREEENPFGENFEVLDTINVEDDLFKSKEFYKKLNTLGPDIFNKPNLSAKVQPFKLEWVYGINNDTEVINLIAHNRDMVFFSAAHFGVLYKFSEQKMQFLEGHQNRVTSISASQNGIYLVTGDSGPDNILIIWNSQTLTPVLVFFDMYPDGIHLTSSISASAKYLVSIGTTKDEIQVDFRKWSEGNDKPNGTTLIKNIYGKVIKAHFRPAFESHIAIVMEKAVAFLIWDEENNKLSDAIIPPIWYKGKLGNFTGFTFLENCHEAFGITTEGLVVVYGKTLFFHSFEKAEATNDKIFVKVIKLSNVPLNAIDSSDNVIIIGDSKGKILLLDKKVKIIYWIDNFLGKPIHFIQFNRLARKYLLSRYTLNEAVDVVIDRSFLEDFDSSDSSSLMDNMEIVFRDQIPTDASPWRERWVIRNFIIVQNGQIYTYDYIKLSYKNIFERADDDIAAITVHDEFTYILIGYKNGTLVLYNYEDNVQLLSEVLPTALQNIGDGITTPAIITVLEYSPRALHLACGRSNGELWILEPSILKPKIDPFKFSASPILKICFNANNTQMACCNKKDSVYLLKYDTHEQCWIFLGKTRSHYKPISDMFFFKSYPQTLVSIGTDRHIVYYNNTNFTIGDEFASTQKVRIEQTAIPLASIPFPEKHMKSKYRYIMTTDDQHKYKLFNEETQMCRFVALGPAYGCYEYFPVTKLLYLPGHSDDYILFKTKKHFGLQKLPLTGSPYSFVGCLGHYRNLIDICVSGDGQFVFTCGENDRSVLKWRTITRGVDLMNSLGGIDFEPYYCVIDGGKNGFLFQEMQDLFFYMQILHEGENSTLPRRVSDKVAVTELPDLMRACGYYPTDYDIETLLVDIKYRDFDFTGELKEDVSFLEFVKLYINHKPAYGYPLQALEATFETFARSAEEPTSGMIKRDDFLEMLTEEGEPFTLNQISKCMEILLGETLTSGDVEKFSFDFIPEDIYYETFKEEILGIDMDRMRVDVESEKDQDNISEDN